MTRLSAAIPQIARVTAEKRPIRLDDNRRGLSVFTFDALSPVSRHAGLLGRRSGGAPRHDWPAPMRRPPGGRHRRAGVVGDALQLSLPACERFVAFARGG